MKIAVLADPMIEVPPVLYGGIERIIDMLVRGLVEQGHEVTLFAHPDSQTSARLVSYRGVSPHNIKDTLLNSWSVVSELARGQYDLVHSFGRLAYLLPVLPWHIPKLMSYQREPTIRGIRRAIQLSKAGTLAFTGCSEYIAAKIRPYAPAYAIHNGVPLSTYDFQPSVPPDAPLVFLGRVEYIKGAHLAIEIARQTQKKLIIAGNIPTDHTAQQYFREQVAPYVDGEQIQYIGPVDDQQKNKILGNAAAFLMPILWDEPFGIVMAEAMACGTPVIGLRRGSVPEVIREGVTGYIADDLDGMITAISKINSISRKEVRSDCESRFSDHKVVSDYEQLYTHMLSNSLK